MPSSPAIGAAMRNGLPALLAVGLLGMSAQAVEPARSVPCENPSGLRDTVSNKLMVDADRAPGATEPEDTTAVDADPLEMVPLALDPKMPPQVLAMLLSHAMQQGHLMVLLLPRP